VNIETPKICVTPEELRATIADAEKARKTSRGVMEAEFKDWWQGDKKRSIESAKSLAKWVFEQLAIYRDLFLDWQEGRIPKEKVDMRGLPSFFKAVEPSIRQLIWGVLKYGGQEHVAQYFWQEFAPQYNKDLTEKVWKIYQKYLDDIGGRV
jgi:hypothetical protein